MNLSTRFVPDPVHAATVGTPKRAALIENPAIGPAKAVELAMANLGEAVEAEKLQRADPNPQTPDKRQHFKAPFATGAVDVKLVWLPMDGESLRLCWSIELTSKVRGEMFRVLVDAQSGEVLVRHGLTEYLSDASYRVFTSDSPSPFSPGYPTPFAAPSRRWSRGTLADLQRPEHQRLAQRLD